MTADFTDLIKVDDLGADRFMVYPSGGPGFLFGGLTMAMAMAAAAPTREDGMVPLSLRCSFISFGGWGPTLVEVERVHTSRSFAGRRLRLTQDGKLVAAADIAFHRPQTGPEKRDAPAPPIPGPNSLFVVKPTFGAQDPIEPVEMRSPRPGPPTPHERVHPFWARARGQLAGVPGGHAAALAFLSDYLVTASPFEPGTSEGEGINSHTLEHSLWFHRGFSAEDWMLFGCAPLTQSAGRFVSRGTVHDEAGELVASFVQEGVIRPVRSAAPS
jgi:acyl-CoA thioesterase II